MMELEKGRRKETEIRKENSLMPTESMRPLEAIKGPPEARKKKNIH